jgi:hypothetical protein
VSRGGPTVNGEAIEAWRAVRRLNRDYPNIDRLIAEAERRQ